MTSMSTTTLHIVAVEWNNCPLEILEYEVKPFMASPYEIYKNDTMSCNTFRIRNIIVYLDERRLFAFDVLTGGRRELLDDWARPVEGGPYFPELDQCNEPDLCTLEFKVGLPESFGSRDEHFQHITASTFQNRSVRLYESGTYEWLPYPDTSIICGKNAIELTGAYTMIHVPRQRQWHIIAHGNFEQRLICVNETKIIYDETAPIADQPRHFSGNGYLQFESEDSGSDLIIPVWEVDP